MIYTLNSEKHIDTTSLNLLKIEFKDVSLDLNSFDSIVFTSKNAVRSIDRIDTKWRELDIFVISNATKRFIKQEFNIDVKYTSKTGYGDEFAKELVYILKESKVLYPRAKKLASNLYSILKESGISIDAPILYETRCNANIIDIEPNSAIIFSSPSSVKCFLKNFTWRDDLIAIAIGTTTAKTLPKEIKTYISPKTDIRVAIEFAKTLLYIN